MVLLQYEPRWSNKLRRRIGRRGCMLAVVAGIDISYGLAMVTTETTRLGVPQWWPASIFSMFGISIPVWGYVWIAIGIFALTGIPRQWPDWSQFGAAVALWVWWSFCAAVFYFTTHSPGAWGPGMVYVGFALFTLIAAGWEDPL